MDSKQGIRKSTEHICERWHFTHTWKALAWPYRFTSL